MAYTLSQITSTTPRDVADRGLRRSFSAKDLHRRGGLQRSYSDNHLCYSISSIRASTVQPKLKNSRSVGFFNIQLSGAMIPDTLKSFLFDPETSKEMNMEEYVEESDHEDEIEIHEGKKRANWIERLVELRNNWKGKQDKVESYVGGDGGGCDGEGGCEVEYEEDSEGREISIDRDIFSSLLRHVSWSDTKLFSQLAFLCNMAYVIPNMKVHETTSLVLTHHSCLTDLDHLSLISPALI